MPRRYAGFSPCFRREAGAAGRDTRGIFRVHQFDKVEMFSFVTPDASAAEHERLLAIEEEILQALGIPYRVVDIAVDDLGASAARKFDCEAWLPGQGRYRELTSCSNTTDFQARRLEIRFRGEGPGGRRRCTRSTAPPAPSGARSSRCSRTASARTAGWRCPRCSCPTARRRSCPPVALVLSLAGARTAATAASRESTMSNVVSRRVISNSRSTVGLVHTSAIRPPRRVTRRSPLSRTLRPVESMNDTSVRSRTTDVLPWPIASLRRLLNSGRGRDVDLARHGDDVRALVDLVLEQLELRLGEGGHGPLLQDFRRPCQHET